MRQSPNSTASLARWAVTLAGLALGLAACGGTSVVETPVVETPVVEGTTYTVGVDGSSDEMNVSLLKFFPRSVTVHAGDTIEFQRPENGEMHTVTLGTAVPTSVGIPGSNFFRGGFGGEPIAGRSMPCYLSQGQPPSDGCSGQEQEPVPFDGTQSWHNSGGLIGEGKYNLQLADDIEPGIYSFFCLIHTSEMRGTIRVVDPDQPADDPEEVAAQGAEEFDRRLGNLLRAVETGVSPPESTVLASLFTTESFGAEVPNWAMQFFPEEIEVPVGEPVTWEVRGDHTISFNAPEAARPFYERGDDGRIVENELAATPVGVSSSTTWDGAGFLNSGLLSGFVPPRRFSITFTQPGTYTYFCLVHFGMEGKVNVTG